MFPLNDFNFVACALATFSAAVGYNVSRRRGRNTSSTSGHAESERAKEKEGRLGFLRFHRRNSVASARSASAAPSTVDVSESDAGTEPPSSKCGTPIPGPAEAEQGQLESFPNGLEIARPEDGSLKRKRSPAPRLADADTPPFKRRRTPPAEDALGGDGENDSPAVKLEEGTSQLFTADDNPGVAESTNPVAIVGAHAEVWGSAEVLNVTEQVLAPGKLMSSPPSANVESSAAPAPTLTAPSAPPPCLSVPATTPSIRLPTPGPSWYTGTPLVAARPSSAFSAFTGQGSAFVNSCAAPQRAPVWTTSTTGSVSVFGNAPSASTSSAADPLAASTQSTATAQKVLTGEEDEEVETELKGAKVFIKRGDRDFCEGILGNVKLLKHKETGDHRILFRREPVWKVTMSVRLRPTVRCSLDEAQSVLRVTLREPIEDTQHEHLVIYALKRGKASRSEFAEFAKTVAGSARLQEQQARV
ncbi:hypothetical protein GSI_12685 [Ganoderma sinense ZZ0214-1]|uniref:RanBD1 domain-containing protein n=1 Tax=Ganoderma sinense ZZ0214-1 TaxID=1077348 RepID=A0A2G8RTG9_9APHY|nr:hypothetical protein GSI_12685 [Ganoderma sinense ZZ0214-1]